MDKEKTQSKKSFIQEFTIMDVVKLLLSKIVWIALVGIVFASATYIYVKVTVAPTYSSYTTLYVFASEDRSKSSNISSGELSSAVNLANTYKEILQSNKVMSSIAKSLKDKEGINVPASTLSGMCNVSTVNDTQLMKISVTSTDPVLAAKIANICAKVAPEELIRVTKAGSVEIVDEAVVPTFPSGPNPKKNAMYAGVIGVGIACAFFFLKMILNTTIYSQDDAKKFTDLPVLGSIPSIGTSSNDGKWTFAKEGGNSVEK